MGQTAGKITDSEMCCGGKRTRDRNNNGHIKHNPAPAAASFADSLFNFGTNDENQQNYSDRYTTEQQPQPFIEPAPRETGPRRGVVQRKAPKFTIVAEPDPPVYPAQQRPNESMLHEVASHQKPLGARASQHHSAVPYSTTNVPRTNGPLSMPLANIASSTGNLASIVERERKEQPNDGYYDTGNLSRTSTSSAGASGSLYSGNTSARSSLTTGLSSSFSRSFCDSSPGVASGRARTVSSSPLAPVQRMPANPLAARGQLPEGALPRKKVQSAPAAGRADHYLPTSYTSQNEAGSAEEDTTESFIAEVKNLIDKSKEQLRKAEFRRSRKNMLAQQDLDAGMPPPPHHYAPPLSAPHAQSFLAYSS